MIGIVCLGLLFLAPAAGRSRWAWPLLLGFIGAALVNLPWIAQQSAVIPESWGNWIGLLTRPTVVIAGSAMSGLLILVGAVRLVSGGSPEMRMARTLERRRDFRGAAELYERAGRHKRAVALYAKDRAWVEAARASRAMRDDRAAASYFRRAGGRHLQDAAAIYRRLDATEDALTCERSLAEWLTSQGHLAESLEAWLRAGDAGRAARLATMAIRDAQLQPSHPAFGAARRAAQECQNHALQAQLFEAEGHWDAAGQAWMAAENPKRAAAAYSRSGRLEDAARAELAAGRPRQAAMLRMKAVRQMAESLRMMDRRGTGDNERAREISRRLDDASQKLIPLLASLNMTAEMIDLMLTTGRHEEAVQRLVEAGREGDAVELARQVQRWDLAAPILERLNRWGEASDVYELSGELDKAARCAELAGEDARALELYRGLGRPMETAQSLARIGRLSEALSTLHARGMLAEACEILRSHPGPVPDIPDAILDMAEDARRRGRTEEAIACLQRAVLGVALTQDRLGPAVALARHLLEIGDLDAAQEHANRILQFDYAHQPAQELRRAIMAARNPDLASATMPDTSAVPQPSRSQGAGAERRYEIRHELGRGGMGVVYLARDTRLVRDVAIKVLRTTSDEEAQHLEREAQAAATLNHPGIVTIYDFEQGFDGYFISMEFVDGRPLDEVAKRDLGRVQAHLRAIMQAIAMSLAYAHQHQVIHRDIKPGNVLLTDDGQVKILDFGIATRMDVGTASGGVCGTPYYMAPEQIRGEIPSPATDVYSFGATAFHLATGHPPFPKGNVIEAHLEHPAPDPTTEAPGIDPQLAAIILRCLEKVPADRFADGAALVQALA
jgi:predicted Ser/Thr protein kinase